MNALKSPAACESSARCAQCGIPIDAEYFDDSSIVRAPEPGRSVVLARFELPPQYCGVLEYFAQFTDRFGKDASQAATPGLLWTLRVNQRPLYPYLNMERIVNPWGFGSYQIALRLDDTATVELMVQRAGGSSVSTTVGTDIVAAAPPSRLTVAPQSMANIRTGMTLLVGELASQEEVDVLAITATTFTAVFTASHTAPVTVKALGNAIRSVGGRIMGRYWYNPAYGDVERSRV